MGPLATITNWHIMPIALLILLICLYIFVCQCMYICVDMYMCVNMIVSCMSISRVCDQDGISRLYIIVEIYLSGGKPSICAYNIAFVCTFYVQCCEDTVSIKLRNINYHYRYHHYKYIIFSCSSSSRSIPSSFPPGCSLCCHGDVVGRYDVRTNLSPGNTHPDLQCGTWRPLCGLWGHHVVLRGWLHHRSPFGRFVGLSLLLLAIDMSPAYVNL